MEEDIEEFFFALAFPEGPDLVGRLRPVDLDIFVHFPEIHSPGLEKLSFLLLDLFDLSLECFVIDFLDLEELLLLLLLDKELYFLFSGQLLLFVELGGLLVIPLQIIKLSPDL